MTGDVKGYVTDICHGLGATGEACTRQIAVQDSLLYSSGLLSYSVMVVDTLSLVANKLKENRRF